MARIDGFGLAGMTLQPSELAKPVLVLFLALLSADANSSDG